MLTSKQIILALFRIFDSFGIRGRMFVKRPRRSNRKVSYEVIVSGQEVVKFAEHFMFDEPHKQTLLLGWLAKIPMMGPSRRDVIPFGKREVYEIYKKEKLFSTRDFPAVFDKRRVSLMRTTAQRLLDAFPDHVESLYGEVLRGNVFFERVVRIEVL